MGRTDATLTGKGWLSAIFACVLAAALCACANTSVYRPATSEGGAGYRETAMANGHYLVSFTGTISMDLDEVKRYARRRAAEVTLREGYTHFLIFSARNEADIRIVPNGDYWNPENGFLAGYINKNSSRASTRETGDTAKPWVGDPGRRARYTAFTEIAVLSGDDAAKAPDAMAAMEVLDETSSPER
jgi:hypothetical protein